MWESILLSLFKLFNKLRIFIKTSNSIMSTQKFIITVLQGSIYG